MVKIKQEPDTPVAAEILATAILKIDDAMQAMLKSGLKRRTIETLVAAKTGLAKRDVALVLDALESLRKDWCSR